MTVLYRLSTNTLLFPIRDIDSVAKLFDTHLAAMQYRLIPRSLNTYPT
jgi:hypothetical protein